MPNPLPLLLLDAAELGGDLARGGGPSSNKALAEAFDKKHKDLESRREQLGLQLAEIEKFHMELTGKHRKEASSSALVWVGL